MNPRAQADGALRGLRQAAERISANLVELELDSSRQLLEASTLTGYTAERWSAASASLTELWRRHGLLEQLLERAEQLHGARRANDLRALLEDRSIVLSSADVPLADRALLGGTSSADRRSPAELLSEMSAAFDEVRDVVAGVGHAWEALVPKLDAARREHAEAKQLAGELGGVSGGELERAAAELDRLSRSVTGDPLSVAPSEVDALAASLHGTRAELDHSAELKRSFAVRMLATRGLLDELRTAASDARRAHADALVKIAAPALPAAPSRQDDLLPELERISELAERSAWPDARRALEAWTARAEGRLAEAREALEACRAPIDARNQFRALLDAYQVKARRLGRVEDEELAAIYGRARDALYRAPTDLGLVAQLVRSFQERLDRPRPGQEASG